MIITRRQLRKIIKEELSRTLREGVEDDVATISDTHALEPKTRLLQEDPKRDNATDAVGGAKSALSQIHGGWWSYVKDFALDHTNDKKKLAAALNILTQIYGEISKLPPLPEGREQDMRITRRQLRKIIKEELSRALNEDVDITIDNVKATVDEASDGSMITASRGSGEQDLFYRVSKDKWTTQYKMKNEDILGAVLPEDKKDIEAMLNKAKPNDIVVIPRENVDPSKAPGTDSLEFKKHPRDHTMWIEVGEVSDSDVIDSVKQYLESRYNVYRKD